MSTAVVTWNRPRPSTSIPIHHSHNEMWQYTFQNEERRNSDKETNWRRSKWGYKYNMWTLERPCRKICAVVLQETLCYQRHVVVSVRSYARIWRIRTAVMDYWKQKATFSSISIAKLITCVGMLSVSLKNLFIIIRHLSPPPWTHTKCHRSLHGDIKRCSSVRHSHTLVHPVGMSKPVRT
jgi:hypothetical protein